MTPTEHAQHIRELEFKLYKAENGMDMPYSREDVAHYRRLIDEAKRSLAGLPVDIIRHFTANDNAAVTGYDILSDGRE